MALGDDFDILLGLGPMRRDQQKLGHVDPPSPY
jgi:hypothetical protein